MSKTEAHFTSADEDMRGLPEVDSDFLRQLQRDRATAKEFDPTAQKMTPELRRRVWEVRYFGAMNAASKAFFWRSRYGIQDAYYSQAPLITPGMPDVACVVADWQALKAGELTIMGSLSKGQREDLRNSLGLKKITPHRKDKIKARALGDWLVAAPNLEYIKGGPEDWKAEVDSPLVYSPRHGHKHGIRPWRELTVEDLLREEVQLDVLVNVVCALLFEQYGRDGKAPNILEISPRQLWEDGCTLDKHRVRLWFGTYRDKTPPLQTQYTHGELVELWMEKRDIFYELMMRVAIYMHHLANMIDYRLLPAALSLDHHLYLHDRRFTLVVWQRFAGALRLCAMKPHHYILLAAFHPFFVSSNKFLRHDKARIYLTADELKDLCSAIETTETIYPKGEKIPKKIRREYDRKLNRIVKVEKPPKTPKRGYFVGWHSSTTLSEGDTTPVLDEISKWMRSSYNEKLEPKRGQVFASAETLVANEAVGEKISREHDETPILEAKFLTICASEEFREFIGEEIKAPQNFRYWLLDPNAANKTGSIPLKEFLELDEMDQMDLAQQYFGYRQTCFFEETVDDYLEQQAHNEDVKKTVERKMSEGLA